jgi:serine/threonine-protein kinase
LILHHLADTLRALRKLDEAEKLARQAVEIYRANADKWHGQRDEHRHAIDILVETLVDSGKPDEAILVRREFVEDLRRLLPAGDLSLASALAQLGLLLLQHDEFTEAEPILRECLAIREQALGPDCPDYWKLANTRSMLGGALTGQGAAMIESDAPAAIAKFTEAELLLVESGEWLTQNADRIPQDVRAERLRQALEWIVRLYEFWDTAAPGSGKAEQAARWRAELQNLPGP